MEERYEIRAKIGQGGLGAVYRGYDTRMNREVAIKRISVSSGDADLQEESTRQLIKEAGALASLQHPHIVTIYDVGSDEDGPYVVMELISGKTLDELIGRAPLTWADFRELALQTEEALIAAHELNLIHSDIKPSNLMLSWLPSGKFQVKIVDFGLATLTQSQSLEELQTIEAVFGSIFFMAPEQFERVPIDARTDLYSLGCVFYQALTGNYPFKGETGYDVMVSHLHHQVPPLQDVRSDIPLWACDWIMWHINRQAADRPESARQALQVFLQNDAIPNPPLSRGRPAPAAGPTAPRRPSAPGSGPAAPRRPSAPAAAAPAGTPPRPRIDPRTARPGQAAPVAVAAVEAPAIPEPPITATAPQPLLPPEGSKPSIYNEPQPTKAIQISPTKSVPLHPSTKATPTRAQAAPPRKSRKKLIRFAIAGVLLALVISALVMVILQRQQESHAAQRFTQIIDDAANPGTREISMSGPEFAQLMTALADSDNEEQRAKLYRALALATANDGAELNSSLTEFATKSTQLLPEVREQLIREALVKRASPAMAPALTEFARTTNDTRSAIAALQALRGSAGDEQFEALLTVAQFHPNEGLRKAAEESVTEIVRKSKKRDDLLKLVDAAIKATTKSGIRESLLRIQTAGKS